MPEYMIWLQKGDFTNCPKTTFIYGSDETLYACAPSFEAAMQKYGVDYEMIVGKGCFTAIRSSRFARKRKKAGT